MSTPTQNKIHKTVLTTNTNIDYLNFVRSNHKMIERHLLQDFQHPYKMSLLMSKHKEIATNNVIDGSVFISKKLKGVKDQSNSHLQPIQQNLRYDKQIKTYKKRQNKNFSSFTGQSQKIPIYNSLNYFKNSQVSKSIKNTAKEIITRQQIQQILQQKNKQISQQLLRSRNNLSDIVYKSSHHSNSLTNYGNDSKSIHSPMYYQIQQLSTKNIPQGSSQMKIPQDKKLSQSLNLQKNNKNVKSDNINSLEPIKQKLIRKFRQSGNYTQMKMKNNNDYEQYDQRNIQHAQNKNSNLRYSQQNLAADSHDSKDYLLKGQDQLNKNTDSMNNNNEKVTFPQIKKRTQSLIQQMNKNSNVFNFVGRDEHLLMAQMGHKSNKNKNILALANLASNQNSQTPLSKNQSYSTSNPTSSASINQLRKQFQQNSDAIKLYKKVQKNNIALNVRQINQKNLKSYYEYQNSIIRNNQMYIIDQEKRKKQQDNKSNIYSEKYGKAIVCKVDNNSNDAMNNNQKDMVNYSERYQIFSEDNLSQYFSNNVQISSDLLKDTILSSYPRSSTELEQQLIQNKKGSIQSKQLQDQYSQINNSSSSSPNKSMKKQQKQPVQQQPISINKAQNTVYDYKVKSYRQFVFKIYFAHKKFTPLIIKQLTSTTMKNEQKFKFYVGPGNNSLLIKSLMKRRFWWALQEDPKKAHFVWTQLKINTIYQFQPKAQIINAYYKVQDNQDNSEIIKKSKKIKRKQQPLNQQAQKQKKSSLFKAPLPQDDEMKIFTNYDKKIFSKFSQSLNQMYNPQKMDNFQKRIPFFPPDFFEIDKAQQQQNPNSSTYNQQIPRPIEKQHKMHNHFQFNHFIGNKKALFYNLRYYYQIIGKDVYDIIPLTFHIKNGVKDPQYNNFLKYYKTLQRKSKSKNQSNDQKKKQKKQKNIWIIKPGENSNRGNGIQVFDQIYELNNILKKKDSKHKNGQQLTYIVQKYIEKPLLYKNRKFDIRHYFMVSRLWGKLRVYFFGQGYIRTSSYEFDLNEVGDSQIHLTNDAIQKHCDKYGKYEQANKLSYVQFQRYLDSLAKQQSTKTNSTKNSQNSQKKPISFANDIYPQMRHIATQAVRACYIQLDPNKVEHNFQIFGMDFMIDKDYKVWLIQINTNPCLQLSSKLLERVIPSMLQQSLKLTIDVIFPPKYHYPNAMKHMMSDYSLQKMKFQLIFDQDRDGKQLQMAFQKRKQEQRKQGKKSIRQMLLGQIDEEDETYENDGKQINVAEKGGDIQQ